MKNTKRIIKNVFCALTVTLAAQSNAQTTIGLKIGANLASMSFEESDFPESSSKNKIGFNIALPINFKINHFISFQPELSIIGKGVKINMEEKYSNGPIWEKITMDYKYKLQYIEIPTMFKFGVNNDKFQYNFLIGPSLGILTKAQMNGKMEYSNSDGDFETETDDYTPSIGLNDNADLSLFDICANLGVEAGIKLGSGFMFAEGRFQTSLLNISLNDDSKTKNSGIHLNIGYRIPIAGTSGKGHSIVK